MRRYMCNDPKPTTDFAKQAVKAFRAMSDRPPRKKKPLPTRQFFEIKSNKSYNGKATKIKRK